MWSGCELARRRARLASRWCDEIPPGRIGTLDQPHLLRQLVFTIHPSSRAERGIWLRSSATDDDEQSAMHQNWVYILASSSRRLYVGVTNDLRRRVLEHKAGIGSKHTARYSIRHLVHVEEHPNMVDAIQREKQIKGWRRSKKVDLIERKNLGWVDLAARLDAEAQKVRAAETQPDPSTSSG